LPDIEVPQHGFVLIQPTGEAELDLQEWMENITNAVNNLQPLTGSGSPESVVTARRGRWYVDVSAPVNEGIYLKEAGDLKVGWVKRS